MATAVKVQFASLLALFTPDVARTARAALAKLRKRVPGACELVYDNYNALAVGFSPDEKAGRVWFSIAVYPRWVTLFIFGGQLLPDPLKLLRGSGSTVRHIVLETAATLDAPGVKALLDEKQARSAWKPVRGRPTRLIIKSVAAKRRPRRPADVSRRRARS